MYLIDNQSLCQYIVSVQLGSCHAPVFNWCVYFRLWELPLPSGSGDTWKLLCGWAFKCEPIHGCYFLRLLWVCTRAGTNLQSFVTSWSLSKYANSFSIWSFSLFFVNAFGLILQWMRVSLLFFRLDSFSLHPYTIWRWFWVHKIQTTHKHRPFFFSLAVEK